MRKLLLTTMLLIFLSCNKEEFPSQIIGTGEIISNAIVGFKSPTLISSDMKRKNHVIKTENDNIFDLFVKFDQDTSYQLIDFSQYTLLGQYASGGGCKIIYDRNVKKDTQNLRYTYKVTVREDGDCLGHSESMNWVLIPKVDSTFSIKFQVE